MKIADLKTFVVGNPPPGFGGRYFIFVKLATDDGIEGVGEVYAATFGPKVMVQMIEDVFERYVARHRPVPHRGPVAQGLRPRLHAAPRRLADGRAVRHRDRPLGHHRQGGRQAGLRAARRPGARAPAHLHLHLPAGRRDRSDLLRRRAVGGARGGLCGAGLHRGEVRSRRALLRLRSAPAVAGAAGALGDILRKLREAVGSKADLLFGTHGQFTASGAIRLAKRLEPYDPLWFEEPRRRRCRRRWRWWRAAPRSRSRPASG